MHRNVHKLEAMHNEILADSYTDIAERVLHVYCHVESDRERPELSQQLRDALQIYSTDETNIAGQNPSRIRANAL